MFGKFVYNVRYLDKAYLGSECFTKPEGSGLWFQLPDFLAKVCYRLHSLDPPTPFKGEVNSNYLPRRGRGRNLKN